MLCLGSLPLQGVGASAHVIELKVHLVVLLLVAHVRDHDSQDRTSDHVCRVVPVVADSGGGNEERATAWQAPNEKFPRVTLPNQSEKEKKKGVKNRSFISGSRGVSIIGWLGRTRLRFDTGASFGDGWVGLTSSSNVSRKLMRKSVR